MLPLPLLLALASAPAQADTPLPEARTVVEFMDSRVRTWIAGRPLETAFAPWRATLRDDDSLAAMRQAGGSRLELLAFELEVTLSGPNNTFEEVRAVITPTREDIGLLELRIHSENQPDGTLLSKASPAASSLAHAAKALGDLLTSPACSKLDVVNAGARWPGAPFLERAKEGLERTRQKIPEACAQLEGDLVPTHFHVDDLGFLVRGDDGSYIGMLEAELEFDDGAVVLQIGRFEPVPPAEEPTLDAAEDAGSAPDPLTPPGP